MALKNKNKTKKTFKSTLLNLFLILSLFLGDFSALFLFNNKSAEAAVGVPKILSHQGRLYDSSGNLLGGTGTNYCFRFSLWDSSTGGTSNPNQIWPSTYATPSTMTVSVKYGVFNVGIGDVSAGGDLLDFNFRDTDTVYLNVEVANSSGGSCAGVTSFETLSPRQRIMSSGYSINAGSVYGSVTSTDSLYVGGVAQLSGATASSTGLVIGNDVVLYRSGSNTLNLQTATTTITGSLGVGGMIGLNGTYINDWSDLAGASDWHTLLNKAATSTVLALLDSDYRIPVLNASTTNIGTLNVYEALNFNGLSNISDLRVATLNASTTANFEDIFAYGNATTTGHLAALGGNSDQWNTAFGWGDHSIEGYLTSASALDYTNLNWYWATSSEQNFWNSTSTWTAYDTNWARNYNATTTLNGFTPGNYLAIADFGTQFASSYNATTTLNGFTNNQTNWNTAYDWGDHSAQGYHDWDLLTNKAATSTVLSLLDSDQRISVLNATTTNVDTLQVYGNATTTGHLAALGGNSDQWNSTYTELNNFFTNTKEQTGFPNRTDSSISFNNSNRNFTISGTNFKVYSKGKEYIKNTQSIQITDVNGLHFVYYDKDSLALSQSTEAWDLTDGTIQIATIHWDGTTGLLGEERHGLIMDGQTHSFLHNTVGSRFNTGLTGTFYSGNTFSITAGSYYDEDILNSISGATTSARILYLSGPASTYTQTAPGITFYDKTCGASQLCYDNNGTKTAATANNYVAYWIFGTNDPNTFIYSIMGNRQDTTLTNAQNNATYDTLYLGNLPSKEMKLLYRIIVRNNAANTLSTTDYRSVSNLPSGTYVATAHNVLTGLDFTNAGHTGFAGTGVENIFTLAQTFSTLNASTTLADYSTSTVSSYLGTTAGLNGVYINNWSDLTGAVSWDNLLSKPATSTILSLLDSDYRIATLNATTTKVGTLHIYTDFTTDDTGLVTNLNADLLDSQQGSYYLDWDNLTNRAATSTILSLLDSDYRISHLNATTTLIGSASTTDSLFIGGYASTTGGILTQGNLHIGGTSVFDGLVSGAGITSAQQNFWNTTSTWTAYDTNWARNYNATTTLNGFTPSNYLLTSNFSWDSLLSRPATSTVLNLLDTQNRISVLNATTTNADTLIVYTGSTLSGLTAVTDLRVTVLNASTTANFNNLFVYGNATTTNSQYIGGDLSVLGNASTSGNLNVTGGSLILSNSGLDEEDLLNPTIFTMNNIDDETGKYLFMLYNPVNTTTSFISSDLTFVPQYDANFDFYGDVSVKRNLSVGYTTENDGIITMYDGNLTVDSIINQDSTFGAMHNSVHVNTDYDGTANVDLVHKVFGNELARDGEISGYGLNNNETNYSQRNWTTNSSTYSGSQDLIVANYTQSSIFRDYIEYNSTGHVLTANDYNFHIDSVNTMSEIAGTINANNMGIYLETVSSDGASITNGTLNTYGIYLNNIEGHARGKTYGIYDTSNEDWYMSGQLGISTSTPWDGYELAVMGDEILSGNLYVLGNATTTGTLSAPFDSYVGNLSTRYFQFQDYNLGVLGTLPTINPYGSTGGAVTDGASALVGDLIVIENDNAGDDTPTIRLTSLDVADTLNVAEITFATTTQQLRFEDSIDNSVTYYFDNNIYMNGSLVAIAADYAEYFYASSNNLKAGEVVCVDITKENSVKRCDRESDSNVMGIISTNPAILGNSQKEYKENPDYAIVAMLGQIPTKASAENGEIRPGDSLTSASIPGYAMKANPGDSTVGVALEDLNSGTGIIQVMISRRNKSITVEEVEQQITERVAEMEIEDEVNLLVSSAIDNLNLDDEVFELIRPETTLLSAKIDLNVELLTNAIKENSLSISELKSNFENIRQRISAAESVIASSTPQAILNMLAQGLNIQGKTTLNEVEALKIVAGEIEAPVLDLLIKQISNFATTTSQLDFRIAALESEVSLNLDELLSQEDGLEVSGLTILSGGLQVDSISGMNDLLVLMSDTEFIGRPYFNADTGGFVVIKQGQISGEVIFEQEYLEQPVVNISLTLEENTTTPDISEAIFASNIQYLVTKKNVKGFTILLNKPAEQDLNFSWVALAIKNPKIIISENQIINSENVIEPEVSVEPKLESEAPLIETEAQAETPIIEPVPQPEPVVEIPAEEPVVEIPAEEPVVEDSTESETPI